MTAESTAKGASMSFIKITATSLVAFAAATTVAGAQGRDQISVVGSSTVFPYTQAVAEQFSSQSGAPSPIVESTGTGGGMQIFCEGIGEGYPDMTGASRGMELSEWETCQENGVEDITQAQIGSDGLSIAVSRDNDTDWDLTLAEVYQALGAQVPVDGEWVDNPHQRWSDINPDLPDTEILVYGPPPTSGTRDAFVELAMHAGCEELDYVSEGDYDSDWIEENCSRMRTDGPFVEAGENDNLIVQRLTSDPNALGIFGYSFLYENQDSLKAVTIEGVEPNEDTIADGSYPISRPLFFYVKNAHRGVIPNLEEFIAEYMSEEAIGAGGYLSERGMVPLQEERRAEMREAVMSKQSMEAPE
jgi:phosphate transport system substrate-binding protein